MSTDLPNIGHVSTPIVEGLEIRVARCAGAPGIPILLTSPWPQSIYAFRGIVPRIEELGPLILVDLPGFGKSQGRPEVLSPTGMGDFIIGLLEFLNLGRIHAVGPDVGTPSLLFAASQRPDLFESLIVGSGAVSTELAGGGLAQLIASPPGALAELEGGDLAVDFVNKSALNQTPTAVLEDYRSSSAGSRFEEAASFVRAYPRDLPRLQRLLPNIQTPVLVLAGRNDPIVPPPNGEFLANHLPHCRHKLLEGGHLIWEDSASGYGEELYQWVKGNYRTVVSSPVTPSIPA